MTLSSCFLLAMRFLFPRLKSQSNKNVRFSHSARLSLCGAVFCVALSLVPVVVVLVVSDGMIHGITNRMIELSSFHLQAIQYRALADGAKNRANLLSLAQNLKMQDGIKDAFVERTGTALVAGKNARSGCVIRAVEPRLFSENESFVDLFTLHDGTLKFENNKSAIIGKALSQKLNLQVGDSISIITMRNLSNGKTVPKLARYTVSAIASSGYQELDALWIFLPLDSAFELFASNVSRIFIGITTEDAFSSKLYNSVSTVKDAVGTNFGVYTWQELNASQYDNFKTSKVLLLFIMMLIVLVATVTISAALVMLVMEHKKEIAILKSTGASIRGITTAFVIVGFLTGLCGVCIGLTLGILCAINVNAIIAFIEKVLNLFLQVVYSLQAFFTGAHGTFEQIEILDPAYYLEEIPIVLPFAELLSITALTMILSIVVSIGPALKAGKEKPLETLRKW